MTVNRYNGRNYSVSGEHRHLKVWLVLSVAIHALLAATSIISRSVQKKISYTPTYQVDLLPISKVPEEVAQKKEEPVPVKPEPVKPEPKKITQKERKAKKPAVSTKVKKRAAKPDDAIAKLREKVAVEEAVENLRKKIKTKGKAAEGKIKIAERPPARVYRYEDMDAELRAYYDEISRIIGDAWSVPESLRNKGLKSVISLNVRRDGTIESLWLEKKSGNRYYDESALRAINKVGTLPPLPKKWKGEDIDLGFNF